jgi:septal ring factor EnvC (AmiA/AmiB activator)
MGMKFRIDKLPKTEKDMQEIQKEIEEEHHHHHEGQDILSEILVTLQSLQAKVETSYKDIELCKNEISRIYRVLSKIIIAFSSKEENQKIKSLQELAKILEE